MEKLIELVNDCNTIIRGTFKYPSDATKKMPIVIMASGYGGSGSLSKTWETFEKKFLENGISTLLFDYTGQGKSDGNVRTLVPFLAVKELRQFIERAKELDVVDSNRIGVLGSSFGGFISLIYCANYDDIKLLGLKSPVSDYVAVREIQLGEQGITRWRDEGVAVIDGVESNYEFYIQSKAIDIYGRLAKFINAKCLIVHGDSDTNVPVTQSQSLNECLLNSELKIVPGANHGYKEGNSFEVMTNYFVNWFKENL